MKDELTDSKSECCGAAKTTKYTHLGGNSGMQDVICSKCRRLFTPSRHKEEAAPAKHEPEDCPRQPLGNCSDCNMEAPRFEKDHSKLPPQSPIWEEEWKKKKPWIEFLIDKVLFGKTEPELAVAHIEQEFMSAVKEAYERGLHEGDGAEWIASIQSKARAERTKEIVEMVNKMKSEYGGKSALDTLDDLIARLTEPKE